MKSFLFANIPLSIVHFVLFLLFKGSFLGQPGYAVANALGASSQGVLWWALMVLNSLVWGAVLSLSILSRLSSVLSPPYSGVLNERR